MVISAHGNSLRSPLVILREHTLGRALTDEEVIKLEVPNSVPIAIRFDEQLNHEEKWSNQHSPEEILAFLQAASPLLGKELKVTDINGRNLQYVNYWRLSDIEREKFGEAFNKYSFEASGFNYSESNLRFAVAVDDKGGIASIVGWLQYNEDTKAISRVTLLKGIDKKDKVKEELEEAYKEERIKGEQFWNEPGDSAAGSPLTLKEFSKKLDSLPGSKMPPREAFLELIKTASQLSVREEISENIQDKIYETISRILKQEGDYILKEKSPVRQAHTIGYVLTIIESGLSNYIVSEDIKLKLIQAIEEALIKDPVYLRHKREVDDVITLIKEGNIKTEEIKGFIENDIMIYPSIKNVINFEKGKIAELLEKDERAGIFIASVREAKKTIVEQNGPARINKLVKQSLFDAIEWDGMIKGSRIDELDKILVEQASRMSPYPVNHIIKNFLDEFRKAVKDKKERIFVSILDKIEKKYIGVSPEEKKEKEELKDFLAQGLLSYYLKAAQEAAGNKQIPQITVDTAKKVIQFLSNPTNERYFYIELSTVASAWNKMKRSSSALNISERTLPEIVGGIDFRQMNMLIQPQGSFASSSLDFSLPSLSKAEIESFDLDKELSAIQKMASSGIAPSDERLKEYLAVCFAKERTGSEIDNLKLCLLDVFEQQQLEAQETPNGYKEVLVIADTRGYVLKEGRLAASKHDIVSLN